MGRIYSTWNLGKNNKHLKKSMNDTTLLAQSNRYTDLKTTATGQFSIVYRAQDTLLDRPVALKCPKEKLIKEKPQYRAIFARESKFMASLDHPNIIPLYDYYESSQGPVIVMRFVPNTLLALHKQSPDTIISLTAQTAREIAAGLDYCTSRGIAHRDVKPDNVLIDNNQHVYLADFGLAAPLDDTDQWSEPIGAKPFISPELFTDRYTGRKAKHREKSDQFSFAVLLYLLMTGELPFPVPVNDESHESYSWKDCTAYRLLSGHHLQSCSERNPLIPSPVDAVVARMLSIEPDDRYPTNEAAILDLNNALSGRLPSNINIFISYSRADRLVVSQLVEHLKHAGIQVWWDPDIEYGSVWEDEIEKAMLSSNLMLVFLSKNSENSSEMKNEWRYWLNFLKKPLVTLVHGEECRIPYRLFPRQHIYSKDRTSNEIASELISAIKKAVTTSQANTEISSINSYTTKISIGKYALGNLPVLFNLDVEDELKDLNNQGYVPNKYRLPLLPQEITDEIAQAFYRK